ncbi:melanoma-associated antigen 10-like [Cervus canadensis]|uniref:melanoma-associated antigen 10-like n=1 Tax=Cervus canadensis TaxID=1574408 RepID=UPI001CA3032E|nr:melanoma-associated antigen 10-like [Cervus canadensis]XP_043314662.1 melanoma-associated antigen 10-like [Cervus canadensis]XP_043314663.1 melanoma-associated antigen 10-like [Cervus canadensis]
MSELSKPEEDLQDPGEAQGPVEVPLLEAEVGEAASHLASNALASSSATVEALPQEILDGMMANLLKFLLFKYRAKKMTSQAEMLYKVLSDKQEYFPVVFREVSECLQLVFGVDVKEVDPAEHIYILVPTLGLTCDKMLSDGVGLPKAGFLLLVLSVIMQCGDPAPEEAVWGALSRMGVYVAREHCVFGEPRELLTQVWVQEGYLEYQQVPDSHPARYEFLWGPRAYVETSKWQVMAFMLRVNQRALRAFPFLSAEDEREEE